MFRIRSVNILLVLLIFSSSIFCIPNKGVAEATISESEQEVIVYSIAVDGEIKAGTLRFVERVMEIVEEEQGDLLLIVLETPGGLVTATRGITELMLQSDIPIIVFVSRPGGWAFSAGTYILLAADYAFVHPEASIGAAEPRLFNLNEPGDEDSKISNSMTAWIASLAATHGRNEETAKLFVQENLTLSGRDALSAEIIDATPRSVEDAMKILDIDEYQIRPISVTIMERVFDVLSHPYIVSLLLTLGGLGLLFSFRTGEFEVSGAIGVVLLLIGLWGMGVITFNVLGILLLVTGVAFFMVELFFESGFGVFGVLGTGVIVLGIVTFGREPLLGTSLFSMMTAVVLGFVLVSGVFFIIIGRSVAKTIRTPPVTGSEALVGIEARTSSVLNPDGWVRLKGETWKARSADDFIILKDEAVSVVNVKGNTLLVKRRWK